MNCRRTQKMVRPWPRLPGVLHPGAKLMRQVYRLLIWASTPEELSMGTFSPLD